MLKAFKYRLYPHKAQAEKLHWTLDQCREVYNAALQERRDAWNMCHVSISYHQQAAQLPEIKDIRPEYQHIHSQVLQDVLRRVDKAYHAFFRRVKAGQKAGYPRFQGHERYDSFTYPQTGFCVTEDHRVCLSKIGTIKVKFPTGKKAIPPIGQMKTCTVKREGQHWFVVFTCEVEQETVFHPSKAIVGIDMGLVHFATLSDGSTIENPRHYRRAEAKLKKAQETLARKKRGSKRRRKAAARVGQQRRHIRNQRRDFHHKQARKLVTHYAVIVFEKVQPANMSRRPRPKQDEATGHYLPNGARAKAGLNKSMFDAGWGQFQQITVSKAGCAGSRVLFVSPRYTSQLCSGCGALVPKDLAARWHSCACGTELDRDHNAACTVRQAGMVLLQKEVQARTEPSEDAP